MLPEVPVKEPMQFIKWFKIFNTLLRRSWLVAVRNPRVLWVKLLSAVVLGLLSGGVKLLFYIF